MSVPSLRYAAFSICLLVLAGSLVLSERAPGIVRPGVHGPHPEARLAIAAASRGDMQLALTHARRALEARPSLPEHAAMVAVFSLSLGLTEARSELGKATITALKGDDDGAAVGAAARQISAADAVRLYGAFMAAAERAEEDDPTRAAHLYSGAVACCPECYEAAFRLAHARLRAGDVGQGVRALRGLAERAGTSSEARAALAKLAPAIRIATHKMVVEGEKALSTGNTERARERFGAAISLSPSDGRGAFGRAIVAAHEGNLVETRRYLELSLQAGYRNTGAVRWFLDRFEPALGQDGTLRALCREHLGELPAESHRPRPGAGEDAGDSPGAWRSQMREERLAEVDAALEGGRQAIRAAIDEVNADQAKERERRLEWITKRLAVLDLRDEGAHKSLQRNQGLLAAAERKLERAQEKEIEWQIHNQEDWIERFERYIAEAEETLAECAAEREALTREMEELKALADAEADSPDSEPADNLGVR